MSRFKNKGKAREEEKMKVVISKYGRWDESCDWQLERREEKEIDHEWCSPELMKWLGYSYSARYNEYTVVSVDKLKRTVITVK